MHIGAKETRYWEEGEGENEGGEREKRARGEEMRVHEIMPRRI